MDQSVYYWGTNAIFVSAAFVFPLLFFVVAPYGRHSRPGWGPVLPARLGWILMELPSPVCFLVLFLMGGGATQIVPCLLAALYLGHYGYRTFVFPFRMRAAGRTKPLLTVAMAFLFNIFNGSLNGWAISALAPHLTIDWLTDPRFLIGVVLFVVGLWINLQSDAILRRLRGDGETGYKIPQTGLHRHVASPNYFGEIIEWGGFALAAWTLPALAFFAFTIANLAPRAWSNRQWYRDNFDDYPANRKALIPGLW